MANEVHMTEDSKSNAVKPPKDNGFKVPSKSGRKYQSTPWGYHLYHMIKEAKPELLEQDEVRLAYNNVIDCLLKYDGKYESWCPDRYNKYRIGIKPMHNDYLDTDTVYGRFINERDSYKDPKLKQQIKEWTKDILNTYIVLYDLIKRYVVPYQEMKQYDIDRLQWMNACKYNIEKLESKILRWEDCIKEAQDRILEYSQKILEVNETPVLTKFE
jgi:hypothetical protein